MWDTVNWEQAIGIAKMLGEGDSQLKDLKEDSKDFPQETILNARRDRVRDQHRVHNQGGTSQDD